MEHEPYYKVVHFINSTYQVQTLGGDVDFQGTLPECDAYIRLKTGGYM